jgi:hypothetical protein
VDKQQKSMEKNLREALPEPPAGMLLIQSANGVMRTAEGVEVTPEEQAAWLETESHRVLWLPDNGRDPQPVEAG